jgi:hypothetical protein
MRDTTAGAAAALSFIALLVVVLIVFGPLASIWAVNTLFGTAIEYSFTTWMAAAWLHMLLTGTAVKTSRSNS